MKNHYQIANLSINVEGAGLSRVSGFLPFEAEGIAPVSGLPVALSWKESEPLRRLTVEPLYRFDYPAGNALCSFAKDGDAWIFEMAHHDSSFTVRLLPCTQNRTFTALTNMDGSTPKHFLTFGFWVAFGIAALHHQAVPVHSSTVLHEGKALLFLGESGTGKSTQSQLWLRHVPGTELLNDDSPVLRIMPDGEIRAFGFPLSGKTPCYKNKSAPVAAIVRLSQAPRNRITRLQGINAFCALLPSCPPLFRYEPALAAKINGMVTAVVKEIPAYHFECTPGTEAALTVLDSIR